MKKEINFPLIFGDKVYYNLEEIPENVLAVVYKKLDSGHEMNYSTLKWEFDGVVYEKFEDIPSKYQSLLEDKDNDGLPDIVEETLSSRQKEEKAVEIKKTHVKSYTNDSKNNPHKEKYAKKGQYIHGLNYFWIPLLIMISLLAIAYFYLKK